MYKKEKGYVF